MDDESPSFEIYHDPPDEDQPSPNQSVEALPTPTRIVLAEIRLPSWGNEANCDSALKHEMRLSRPATSAESDIDFLCESSEEESKENMTKRSLQALSLKTPPRKSTTSGPKLTTPTYTKYTLVAKSTPLSAGLASASKRTPRALAAHTSLSPSFLPFRI